MRSLERKLAARTTRLLLLCTAAPLASGLAGCATLPDDFLDGPCTTCPKPVPEPNPSPTPSPAPSSTPSPTGSGDVGPIAAATLGSNPLPPATPSGDYTFEDGGPSGATENFRLLQSPRTASGNPIARTSADSATASGGATLTVEWSGDSDEEAPVIRFTLGNAALGVDHVELGEPQQSGLRSATLSDGRTLNVLIDTRDQSREAGGLGDGYQWTAYGYWNISHGGAATNASPFIGGYETPDMAMPTTGSATFSGFVNGSVTVPGGDKLLIGALVGDANLTANFANGTISGAAPSMLLVRPGVPSEAWNSLSFAGSFTKGINGFSGTTKVESAPGGAMALQSGASGYLTGRFFGPQANELGAIWNVSDGTAAASGTIVGRR